MQPFKGWIALDIDGTVTLDRYTIPKEVVDFLREKTREGWRIAMATGRPLVFASIAVSRFDFPFLFLIQNGSLALEMPGKKELFQSYLPTSSLHLIESSLENGNMLVYSGYERGDSVYYQPKRINRDLSEYWDRQKETPAPVDSFAEIRQPSVPLVKCFGTEEEMKQVVARLEKHPEFNVALLRDPFVEGAYLLLITDRQASKGQSLQAAIERLGKTGPIIAAGDDENDASLLQIADVAIAMEHSPPSLKKLADLIAPPTKDLGILHALRIALEGR